jgi:hypothetical protein
MKTNAWKTLLGLALIGALNACDKQSVTENGDAAMNEVHVASLVAASLGGAQSTDGFATQIERAACAAANEPPAKTSGPAQVHGLTGDTTFTVQKDTGLATYQYHCHYAYDLSTADTMQYAYTVAGWLNAPHVSSIDTAVANLTVANVTKHLGFPLLLNGSYVHRGTHTVKTSKPLSIRSQIVATWRDVAVSRSTRQIAGGSGTCAVTGVTSNAATFTWYATVSFQGNQQAIVVVGGKSFRVDLSKGEATPI